VRSIRVEVVTTPGGASGVARASATSAGGSTTCSRHRAQPRGSARHSSGPTCEAPITLQSEWTPGNQAKRSAPQTCSRRSLST
jgi:hypothetical protein